MTNNYCCVAIELKAPLKANLIMFICQMVVACVLFIRSNSRPGLLFCVYSKKAKLGLESYSSVGKERFEIYSFTIFITAVVKPHVNLLIMYGFLFSEKQTSEKIRKKNKKWSIG